MHTGCPGVFDLLGTRKCSTRLTGFWDMSISVNIVVSTAVGGRRTSSDDLSRVYMYAFFIYS